ncbi:MAG: DUF2442 domain-containing protein [Bacteroidota bacterium]|nr:DUF2442 domain-containing protein [Bacteroidota bacterium]
MLHLVKKINKIEPYKLELLFNTGEIKTVDFYQSLNEWSNASPSKFGQLLVPEYFKTVNLDPELETIYWDNGIDFCPDNLYKWGE